MPGNARIHSFHISRPRYFLCSFIRLSNELMVFQFHSVAVQRAGRVTGNIWCNFCVDKWEAKFPGCKAYGHNSAWAGPGRAPFFGCQVAPGQSCGGAVQSAPSNWNVDWSAGTDPCLFLSHWRTCMHMSTHIRLRTSFCVFILSKSIGNFLSRPGNPRIWDKIHLYQKDQNPYLMALKNEIKSVTNSLAD